MQLRCSWSQITGIGCEQDGFSGKVGTLVAEGCWLEDSGSRPNPTEAGRAVDHHLPGWGSFLEGGAPKDSGTWGPPRSCTAAFPGQPLLIGPQLSISQAPLSRPYWGRWLRHYLHVNNTPFTTKKEGAF